MIKKIISGFIFLLFLCGQSWGASISLTITTGSDDCGEVGSGHTFSTSGEYHSIGERSGDFKGGWRWQNVTIPQGNTIDACTLTLIAAEDAGSQDVLITLTCEDTSSTATFSDEADFDARFRTSASVNHTTSGEWDFEVVHKIGGLQSIIQEVISRGDWSSGNDLVMFHVDNGSQANNYKTYFAYDGDTASGALVIYYSAPGAAENDRRRPMILKGD